MDGLEHMASGIWLAGPAGPQQYFLSGAAISRAEASAHLLSKRLNPLEALVPAIKELRQQKIKTASGKEETDPEALATIDWLRERAFRELQTKREERIVTDDELKTWLYQTDEGFLWFLWRQLTRGAEEKGLPKPTQEEVKQFMLWWIGQMEAGKEKKTLMQMSMRAEGTDALGNSTGRTPATGSPANGTTASDDTSPGNESFASLQRATDGHLTAFSA